MFSERELLAGTLLPAAITATVSIAGWRLLRHRHTARDGRSWSGPLAIAAGFSIAFVVAFGWNGLPPHDAIDWLPLAAWPLAALGLADSYYRLPPPLRVLSIAAAVPVVLLRVAWPLVANNSNAASFDLVLAAVAAAALSLIALDQLAARMSTGRCAAILLPVTLSAMITLGCSGSARYALTALMLAGTQAGLLAAGVVLGHASLARGAVVVVGTLLAALLLCGLLYAELSVTNAVLLAVAPHMAWIGRHGPRRYGWLLHLAVQVALVAAVAALPAVLAWREYTARM